MQRIRHEAFRTTRAIYIEPFASRVPLVFLESTKSYGEWRDVKWEILEALRCVTTMGEGLEETLKDLWKQTPPSTPQLLLLVILRRKNRLK